MHKRNWIKIEDLKPGDIFCGLFGGPRVLLESSRMWYELKEMDVIVVSFLEEGMVKKDLFDLGSLWNLIG
jgi:hypothetical protein